MRITSKGQVTIPQAIREAAGLHPGSEVEFEYRRGQVILRAAPADAALHPAVAALRRARGSATEPMFEGWSTDQIMAFLRGDD